MPAGDHTFKVQFFFGGFNFNYLEFVENTTGINDNDNSPKIFYLYQNYPNPFNPLTKIKFTIPSVGTSLMKFVQLKIYDVLGKEVKTLVNEEKRPGIYEVEFDAGDLTNGVYFYQLKTDNYVSTKKMLIIK